jgi:hypothetical protein
MSQGVINAQIANTEKNTTLIIRGIHSYSLYGSPLPFLKNLHTVRMIPAKHKMKWVILYQSALGGGKQYKEEE